MERWIFLHDEPPSKIREFAYALEKTLGDNWDFSEHVKEKIARQPTSIRSLDACFREEKEIRDQKLVIGQEFVSMGPIREKIRFGFRYGAIWADYIADKTPKNCMSLAKTFQETFGYDLENYPSQSTVR